MWKSLTTLTVVFLVLVATIVVFLKQGKPWKGIDDAQIVVSYGENLAAGKGVAYGLTQQRVEGYTSVLWMLLCASSFFLKLDEYGVLALSVTLLCHGRRCGAPLCSITTSGCVAVPAVDGGVPLCEQVVRSLLQIWRA